MYMLVFKFKQHNAGIFLPCSVVQENTSIDEKPHNSNIIYSEVTCYVHYNSITELLGQFLVML